MSNPPMITNLLALMVLLLKIVTLVKCWDKNHGYNKYTGRSGLSSGFTPKKFVIFPVEAPGWKGA